MSTDGGAGSGSGAAGAGGNGTPPASSGQGAPPASSGDWTTSLNDELKGYVQNKGFKAPQDVLESYRNFEKLQGVPQERLLKLPENMDTPEGRAVLERLGMPKEPKDYGFKAPEGEAPETYDKLAQAFHAAGLTKAMAEKVMAHFENEGKATLESQTQAQEAKKKEALATLQKEWGTAFEQNKEIVNQGAKALGLTNEQMAGLSQALGPDKAMLLLHKLSVSTGEHKFVAGNNANGGINTPQQAQNKINELIKDSNFFTKMNSGDAAAKQLWDKLHQEAFAGMQSL